MCCLDTLAAEAAACTRCPLGETRTNIVFSGGRATAPLLLVGEAPGREEDESGLPFVGKSGKLLDRLLAEAGLCREKDIYIANILKCRPPQNRAPKKSEINRCLPFLQKQVELVHPKLIVCVGRVAAQTLIRPDIKLMAEHGKLYCYKDVPITATLHPAAILRNPHNLPLAQQDWQAIAQYVGQTAG